MILASSFDAERLYIKFLDKVRGVLVIQVFFFDLFLVSVKLTFELEDKTNILF